MFFDLNEREDGDGNNLEEERGTVTEEHDCHRYRRDRNAVTEVIYVCVRL